MLNTNFFILLCFLLLSTPISAKEKKKVEIIAIDQVYVESFKKKNMELSANLQFYNPYRIKINLKHAKLDVFVDDQRIGTILKEGKLKLKKKSVTDIPMNAHVVPGKTIGRFMANSGKMLIGRKIEIQFIGRIRLRALFLPLSIKLNETAKLGFSDFKGIKPINELD